MILKEITMATKEEIMKFMVFAIFLAVACIVSAYCAKYSPFVKNDKLPYILSIIGFSIMIAMLFSILYLFVFSYD
jgi:Na+/H+-translocating membrane pyrophosphatase